MGSTGEANELVDQGAAARGIVKEWRMAARDDLEPRVGYERARALADLRPTVGILVAPDHQYRSSELLQFGV
jgi:hypothetical protein